jgi:ketosteroid isomerase-like protein
MTVSEAEIRTLIENWASAVRAQRIDDVLAHHTDDIVMFDVPPPVAVKGIDAYRATWPEFFAWQRAAGGSFEIVSLDVTAGVDVAFATAVLRCASKEALKKDDTPKLRLTLGLRREGGAWQIAHEHHSFPLELAA